MQMLPLLILPLHMLAALAWAAPAILVALNRGVGGETFLRLEMGAAVVAFASGAYLWSLYYGAHFGTPQAILAVGVVAAIAAAGVQGAMVGPAARRLAKGEITEEAARPRIALAYRTAAVLLVIAAVCMVMARQA
ncbi:MAG TPA: hypothetical protein VL358_07825 [Caulobacteraceae bacterium]|jgi:hypothetical protein|nr:hypothetical protein [Caulobacteraceae bacterium]